MAKLQWDKTGERFYETGVDHGVLYPMSANGQTYDKGVAWNGLTAVTESPEGAEVSAIYADNIKYLQLMSAEDFKATIEAYTYPDEFEPCDGSANIAEGVKIGQQPRKAFGFCYRTKIGNDVSPDLGYKLHIIYGALAAPSERAYQTVNDSPEAMTFSWEISTTPVEIEGYKPTAHIEIDTTKLPAGKLELLEAKLYGDENNDPVLLMPDEIVDIINGDEPTPALQLAPATLEWDESTRKITVKIPASNKEKMDQETQPTLIVSVFKNDATQIDFDFDMFENPVVGENVEAALGLGYFLSQADVGTEWRLKVQLEYEGLIPSEMSNTIKVTPIAEDFSE